MTGRGSDAASKALAELPLDSANCATICATSLRVLRRCSVILVSSLMPYSSAWAAATWVGGFALTLALEAIDLAKRIDRNRYMDAVEQAILADWVERHDNGCWIWSKPRNEVNIIRLLAELLGQPLPAGTNLYRMPECLLGAQCVNPRQVGTHEEWMARVRR